MSKKCLTEMAVDQPQKSQSMDLWIGISVYFVKLIVNKDGAQQWPLGTKRSDIDPLKTYEKAALAIQ